jgi:hypothetical protein
LRTTVIAAAILRGGAMLLVGLIHLADPGYGLNFLQMTGSVYPWFHSHARVERRAGPFRGGRRRWRDRRRNFRGSVQSLCDSD